ncbi:MAG: TonB-dependent receptor [Bacteroidetes bacterium]|nr:TonB-dependent receptor [Bacteroidota bacterium]
MSRSLLFLFTFMALVFHPDRSNAQSTLSGMLFDSTSLAPLSNVNISVDGVKSATTSNEKGEFVLTGLADGYITIHFTHVSYRPAEYHLNLHSTAILPSIYLVPASVKLKDVFVTADRLKRSSEEIPGMAYTVSGSKAQVYSINNSDDLLYLVPGIRVDRDRGIFSKNSSISMRGLNGSYRVLVLLDGAPINKADGAGINWNRIDPDIIDRIEILKGPNSTIYGGSAMGGVVNIITSRDPGPFRARIKTFYGTYNTFGGGLSASGAKIKNGKGIYWSVNGFYRKGDGYIPVADSLKDSLDSKTYLKEIGTSFMVGYQLSPESSVEAEYDYYWDKRGDGTFIYEPGGSYNQYPSHFTRVKYQSRLGRWQVNATGFYQLEHYLRQNETIKKQAGKYTLYKTDSRRTDAGLWLTAALQLNKGRRLTTGFDLKSGGVEASDLYYTSTDILTNKGQMDIGAAFAQFEMPVLFKCLFLEAGIRFDAARFHGGSFTIRDPGALTEFMTHYPTQFHDTTWLAISPRLAFWYHTSSKFKLYISYAQGFRAPTLDDVCRNGNITKGFKLANPALGPERLNNIEAGYSYELSQKLRIEHSVYFSFGKDFQYFVASGDSVYTGGNNLKPVLQRQNISRVHVLGTELNLNYQLSSTFLYFINYCYNHSRIVSAESSNGKSLNGKTLMEVPSQQASTGVEFRYKWFMAGVTYAYTGKIYADDDNLLVNPARTETGIRVSANYLEKLYLSLNIQDLFDQRYTDNKGNISPGRFMLLSVIWKIQTM